MSLLLVGARKSDLSFLRWSSHCCLRGFSLTMGATREPGLDMATAIAAACSISIACGARRLHRPLAADSSSGCWHRPGHYPDLMRCSRAIIDAVEPSPTAAATRLMDPARISPAAKTPDMDVSSQVAPVTPVRMKP